MEGYPFKLKGIYAYISSALISFPTTFLFFRICRTAHNTSINFWPNYKKAALTLIVFLFSPMANLMSIPIIVGAHLTLELRNVFNENVSETIYERSVKSLIDHSHVLVIYAVLAYVIITLFYSQKPSKIKLTLWAFTYLFTCYIFTTLFKGIYYI